MENITTTYGVVEQNGIPVKVIKTVQGNRSEILLDTKTQELLIEAFARIGLLSSKRDPDEPEVIRELKAVGYKFGRPQQELVKPQNRNII